MDLTNGLSPIHEHWIYLNYIEDEKERYKEIQEMMKEINWRLRPEIAKEIDKPKSPTFQMEEEHIQALDVFFNKD